MGRVRRTLLAVVFGSILASSSVAGQGIAIPSGGTASSGTTLTITGRAFLTHLNQPPVSNVTVSAPGTVTVSADGGMYQQLTVASAFTLAFSNALPGDRIALLLIGDGSAHVITWPTDIRWPYGVAYAVPANTYPALCTFVRNAASEYTCTLSATTALTLSNPQANGWYLLVFTGDGSASTVSWSTTVKWPGAAAPVITTTNGAVSYVVLHYVNSTWVGEYTLDHR